MTRCPTCGRRHRPRRKPTSAAPLPLFDYASRQSAIARPTAPAIRIVLLDACRDAERQPRPALLIPGRHLPTVFPTITAALTAKRSLEAI